MSTKVLYLGDTALSAAASYLAGVLAHHDIEFDYVASDVTFDASLFADDCTALIISDYKSDKFAPADFERIVARVRKGMGLLMIGGYYSFQGINGGARYHGTPVEEVLPVEILPWDDRVEVPEGFTPVVRDRRHPILDGFRGAWPALLGFNEVKPKPDALVLATVSADYGEKPLLVAGGHGKGRTLAWTSDIGPHWLPPEFAAWKGYARLWRQSLGWLVGG